MKTFNKYFIGLVLLVSSSYLLHAQVPDFIWAKMGGGQVSIGRDIIADGASNIYTTGIYGDTIVFGSLKLSGANSFIAKHDAQGNIIWAVNAGYGSLRPESITLGDKGYLYITGVYVDSVAIAGMQLIDSSSYHGFVAKYDTSGNAIWGKGIPGLTDSKGIATDDSGNVYVNNYWTEKFNSGGTLVWTNYFTNVYGILGGCGIDLDARRNVYTSGFDIILGKRNNNGDSVWRIAPSSASGLALRVSDSGYIYVSGVFHDTLNFGPFSLVGTLPGKQYMFIAKYDSSGNAIWAERAGCGQQSGSYPEIENMTLNLHNEIIVAGSITDSAYFGSETLYGTGPFVAEYDAGGNFVWAKVASYGTGNNRGTGVANGVTTDTAGNIYITGYLSQTLHFDTISITSNTSDNMYIAKLAASTTGVGHKSTVATSGSISTWPNPAQHFLNVKVSNVQYRQLGLYDQAGRLVYGANIENGQSIKAINIRDIANGIYYLRLTGDYGSETKKVIILQ